MELDLSHDILNNDEINELFQKASQGCNRSKNKIILHNLKLVVKLAYKKVSRANSMELSDLIQEGILGLHSALRRYDPSKNVKFSTYATWWVRQAIDRALMNTDSMIRVPIYMAEKKRKVDYITEIFEKTQGRCPTEEETLQAIEDLSEKQLGRITDIAIKSNIASIDIELGPKKDHTIKELIECPRSSTESTVEISVLSQHLNELMKSLSEREKDMICLRYGLIDGQNKTLDFIGTKYGITRERVRQVIRRALNLIKENPKITKLKSWLDN